MEEYTSPFQRKLQEVVQQRLKKAYHNIPVAKEIFEEWRVLRDEIGFKTDSELASHLIEHYKERKGRQVCRDFLR